MGRLIKQYIGETFEMSDDSDLKLLGKFVVENERLVNKIAELEQANMTLRLTNKIDSATIKQLEHSLDGNKLMLKRAQDLGLEAEKIIHKIKQLPVMMFCKTCKTLGVPKDNGAKPDYECGNCLSDNVIRFVRERYIRDITSKEPEGDYCAPENSNACKHDGNFEYFDNNTKQCHMCWGIFPR